VLLVHFRATKFPGRSIWSLENEFTRLKLVSGTRLVEAQGSQYDLFGSIVVVVVVVVHVASA
jgi:hypothetical protein